jgi:inosine-uridine nucleoside N-ribohydrolase
MDAAEVRERFRAPLLQPVLDFAAVWFEKSPGLTFHDPLAAAVIFDHRLCQFQKGTINVELTSDTVAGMTHWTQDGPDAPHEVAVAVDPAAFFEHYFAVVR